MFQIKDSKIIETQKHQQSFEALGLFQIDFGLMTLISETILSTGSTLSAVYTFDSIYIACMILIKTK